MHFGKLTPSGVVRAIPILRPESAHHFVAPEHIDPWRIAPHSEDVTSALKFGAKFDLLSLSSTEELYANGTIDQTDNLDFDLSIDKIFYQSKNGDVYYVEMHPPQGQVPTSSFVQSVMGDFRTLELNLVTSVNKFGTPRSALAKLIDVVYRRVLKKNPMVDIQVTGTVNLQFGVVEIHFNSTSPDIRPIGYTLMAFRSNPNRRPAQAAGKCPFIG